MLTVKETNIPHVEDRVYVINTADAARKSAHALLAKGGDVEVAYNDLTRTLDVLRLYWLFDNTARQAVLNLESLRNTIRANLM